MSDYSSYNNVSSALKKAREVCEFSSRPKKSIKSSPRNLKFIIELLKELSISLKLFIPITLPTIHRVVKNLIVSNTI